MVARRGSSFAFAADRRGRRTVRMGGPGRSAFLRVCALLGSRCRRSKNLIVIWIQQGASDRRWVDELHQQQVPVSTIARAEQS